MKLNKAISANDLLSRKFRSMPFEGPWADSFGLQERTGAWLIWGESGNGKTSLALQLGKYLADLGNNIVYNSMEEGCSLTMSRAFMRHNIQDVSKKFHLLDREPYPELMQRLSRRKSPDVIFIDSIQYFNITREQYKDMVNTYRDKLFILASHADGRLPDGAVARSIRYDANVKIRVEGYKAHPTGRDVGGEPFTIWSLGAEAYNPQNI